MSIKLNQVKRYMDQGHSKPFAIRLAEKRDREASKPLSKVSDDVIARRMLEANIWGARK